jgi:hypothetical protein
MDAGRGGLPAAAGSERPVRSAPPRT